MKKFSGFSIIELVVFIVISAILAAAIMVPLVNSLQKSPTSNNQTIALAINEGQMELAYGARRLNGFPPTSSCSVSSCPFSSYQTIATITTPASVTGDTASNYRLVTMTTQKNGQNIVTLKLLTASY